MRVVYVEKWLTAWPQAHRCSCTSSTPAADLFALGLSSVHAYTVLFPPRAVYAAAGAGPLLQVRAAWAAPSAPVRRGGCSRGRLPSWWSGPQTSPPATSCTAAAACGSGTSCTPARTRRRRWRAGTRGGARRGWACGGRGWQTCSGSRPRCCMASWRSLCLLSDDVDLSGALTDKWTGLAKEYQRRPLPAQRRWATVAQAPLAQPC